MFAEMSIMFHTVWTKGDFIEDYLQGAASAVLPQLEFCLEISHFFFAFFVLILWSIYKEVSNIDLVYQWVAAG